MVRRQGFCSHRLHPMGGKACVPKEEYILATFMHSPNTCLFLLQDKLIFNLLGQMDKLKFWIKQWLLK